MTGAPTTDADKLHGVTAVVSSKQKNTIGRVPLGVSQSGLIEWRGVRLPASSVLLEVEAGGGGVRIHSATENGPCQSVPHPGTAGDGGEGECLLGGRNEDLCLVVCSDQNTCI